MNGRTNSSGSSVNDLQIPLDPCTNLECVAGNAQVELTWTDPLNKYATPEGEVAEDPDQLVSVWHHTVVIRKVGSAPVGVDDGIVVVSSEVKNQYQSTAYIDTGLVNDTTYYYGVFAINEDGVESEGLVSEGVTPKLGTPLSKLAEGTIIRINENGSPVEYLIVNQGLPSSMYDISCDGCWVLRKDIYDNIMGWSGSESDYENSIIHSDLNGTFLDRFNDDIKNAIKQVKIPHYKGLVPSGSVESGANGLSCKIFLLSGYEVGWTSSDNRGFLSDGAKLSYFSSGTSDAANYKRIAHYNGSADRWWLRSPNASRTNTYWCVDPDGNYDYRSYIDGWGGGRPALVFPSGILVDNELNILV